MLRTFASLVSVMVVTLTSAQPISGDAIPHCATTDTTNSVHVLFTDSLCSSFLICIPRSVAQHYHRYHTEHVFVLDGAGQMMLGDSLFPVTRGHIVVIPQGTPHAVRTSSASPLRVISIQSPQFDGSDRVPFSP